MYDDKHHVNAFEISNIPHQPIHELGTPRDSLNVKQEREV